MNRKYLKFYFTFSRDKVERKVKDEDLSLT